MPIATNQLPSHGFSLQVNNLQDPKKRRLEGLNGSEPELHILKGAWQKAEKEDLVKIFQTVFLKPFISKIIEHSWWMLMNKIIPSRALFQGNSLWTKRFKRATSELKWKPKSWIWTNCLKVTGMRCQNSMYFNKKVMKLWCSWLMTSWQDDIILSNLSWVPSSWQPKRKTWSKMQFLTIPGHPIHPSSAVSRSHVNKEPVSKGSAEACRFKVSLLTLKWNARRNLWQPHTLCTWKSKGTSTTQIKSRMASWKTLVKTNRGQWIFTGHQHCMYENNQHYPT